MPTGILIEKNGSLKEIDVEDNMDKTNYYKLVGMKRNSKDFKKHNTWEVNLDGKTHRVQLYGKDKGAAGQENKYDLPPPVDETLYFGHCLLINTKSDGSAKSLSKSLWGSIYEHLFGGFEDIGEEDSEDDEDDEDDDLSKTKEGYAKDGFIVEDDDEGEDEDEDDDEDEDEGEDEDEDDDDEPPAPRRQSTRKTKTVASKKINNVFTALQMKVEEDGLDCTSELSEEEYL